jgi:chromosomal replication initiation ATPase DnaA
MVWWLARRHAGMTLAELGQRAGGTDYAAVAMALKRFEARLETDAVLRQEAETLERHLFNVKM